MIKIEKQEHSYVAYAECIHCGKIKKMRPYTLYDSRYTSCTCRNKSVGGLSNSKIYSVYHNMKYRCYNKNHPEFQNYGGKSISVADVWSGSSGFRNFYVWAIQNGYHEGLSIDRIDSSGNYCPENCRWIPLSENVALANKAQHRRANNGRYFGYSPTGEYFEFDNAADFSRCHNLNATNVRQVANGYKKTHKGWTFGFVNPIF